ncbi:MAG: restriction endonuclease subunit S, partial [Treponema sp.]|nr:restriction endonuclease subunit S [Treponema sp.]
MKLIKYKLKDIAYIEISGVDKKTKENETPIKLCNFVNVYHNWAITKDNYSDFMAATANDKEIACCKIKKGQVAITKDSETRDDIGIPTYIADNFDDVLLGYHCALFTPDTKVIDGKYLNAFLNSTFAKKYFEFNASGSGQRYTLSNSVIDEIPVYLPDLPTQKLIGNLFSEIDKKIALNNKTNSELENMAKTVYDYWFTQFDFP